MVEEDFFAPNGFPVVKAISFLIPQKATTIFIPAGDSSGFSRFKLIILRLFDGS